MGSIKNGSNLARFFYALSIISFYVAMFRTTESSVFAAPLNGTAAFLTWFIIGYIIKYFTSDKKAAINFGKSPIPIADELKKLSQKDDGILTEEEFSQQKKKLLSR